LSANVRLVAPTQLADYFALLVSIYDPDPAGQELVEWLKRDWKMFQHERMGVLNARRLLADILEDGEIVSELFVPSPDYLSDRLDRWEQLRNELMYENRYFPETPMDMERLGQLLDHLPAEDMPASWYRARIQLGDDPFKIAEMGAPPKRLSSHGRTNPSGIPYLYLNSSPNGAVSELRPHTGELACVATFDVPPDFKAVDLRDPRKLVSPFVLTDEREIGLLRVDIAFLERLGEELTRPILPQSAAIDYVPSQYLCEFIKKCRYDGVIYRSSVSNGINLALFNPDQAMAREVVQYKVTQVSVETARIT
jgi:hypothetical protein